MWRSPALLSRLPLTNASKWERRSFLVSSSLLLKCACLWAPRRAPSEKWPRRLRIVLLLRTQRIYALFPRLSRIWCHCQIIPLARERLRIFSSAKLSKRLWRSCEHSTNCLLLLAPTLVCSLLLLMLPLPLVCCLLLLTLPLLQINILGWTRQAVTRQKEYSIFTYTIKQLLKLIINNR